MTADDFLWWWVGQQLGLSKESVRADPTIRRLVAEEADNRTHEVIARVMDELRKQERSGGNPSSGGGQQDQAAGDPSRPESGRTRTAGRSAAAGLTVAEAADRLGCSPSKVYRLFDAGELRGHKVGDKRVVDPASVEEFKRRNANPEPVGFPGVPPQKPARGFRHLDIPPRPQRGKR